MTNEAPNDPYNLAVHVSARDRCLPDAVANVNDLHVSTMTVGLPPSGHDATIKRND